MMNGKTKEPMDEMAKAIYAAIDLSIDKAFENTKQEIFDHLSEYLEAIIQSKKEDTK